MAVPKYNELYAPLLQVLRDGGVHSMKEVRDRVAEILELTEEELAYQLPSSSQSVYNNRIGWARTYLKKAGVIMAPQRAHIQITEEGMRLIQGDEPVTNELLAQRYPAFAEFIGKKAGEAYGSEMPPPESTETPQETLARVVQVINTQLAEDLLTEIMNQSSAFFEKLVVDLMRAMGYGDGFVTRASGDDGIDGIIHEDRLGFNLIYVQAKRWNPSATITKPEVQKFAGAMMGPPKVDKGLFITTAGFSQGAQAFAQAQHIILVDGKRLTELMIECGLGVSTQKTYHIKRIDSDYFVDGL